MLGKDFDLTKDRVRRGEMLFNDGAMCFQQWQSCASCHPDGRADALNWDLINDGIGNPKQTKNMLYAHLTPPTMVTGIRDSMAICNRKGLTHIQFVVRPDEDATCIDEYVMSLRPVPSPYLKDGELTKSAKRGEKLFKKAGCVDCHPANKKAPDGYPLFTDLQKHQLLGIGNEEGRAFDTTSLTEMWRTAPYLYDGRALTMEEVLTTCNPKDVHGATKGLSKEEVKDMAEYILSY
jgi:cytochrome c peroxidase